MKLSLGNVWKDPVWSKVISALIIALLASLYAYLKALFNNEGFAFVFIKFWTYSIPIWIYFLFTTFAVIFFVIIKNKKNVSTKMSTAINTVTIFDSSKATPFDFSGRGIQVWDRIENKAVGEDGKGIFIVENGIMTLTRTNKVGRFMILLESYYINSKKANYIKSNLEGIANRKIHITFEARIIQGKHQITIILLRRNGTWITWKNFEIANSEWEQYQAYLKPPSNEDFLVEFEDVLIEKENSIIQLRSIAVEEILA